MNSFKITFKNNDFFVTGFNGTFKEACKYYLNKYFNLGVVGDNMQLCLLVEEVF